MGNGSSTPPFLIPSAVPILGCAHFAPGPWGMGMNVAHLAGRTTAQYANGAPPKERDLLQKSSDDGKPTYIKPYPMADVIKPKAMAVPEVDSGKEGESPPLQSPPPRTEQPVQDLPPSSSTRSEKPEKTEKIVVELVPKNEVSERCVRESGFNPKIQLTTKLSKVISLTPSLPPSKVVFNSAFTPPLFFNRQFLPFYCTSRRSGRRRSDFNPLFPTLTVFYCPSCSPNTCAGHLFRSIHT